MVPLTGRFDLTRRDLHNNLSTVHISRVGLLEIELVINDHVFKTSL